MKIYFARHGDYQNEAGIIPYRLPGYPLSELGRQQAALQAEKLSHFKIRDIFCSPIERTQETAAIIGKALMLHPNIKDELIETGTPLQGLKKEELSQMSPDYPYAVPSHIAGGGESPEIIFERVNSLVEKLKLMSKSSSHLLVSHGDPITIFLIKTLTGNIPHTMEEFEKSSRGRYIPMGGLICLDYAQSGVPKYTEII